MLERSTKGTNGAKENVAHALPHAEYFSRFADHNVRSQEATKERSSAIIVMGILLT